MKIIREVLISMAAVLAFAGLCSAQETAEAAQGVASGDIPLLWWLAPLASIVALMVAFVFYKKVMSVSEGTEKMVEIAGYVREGAYAYLRSQYKLVGLVFVILFAIFVFLAYIKVQSPIMPVAFVFAGFFSGLCGFLGMKTATNASARTAQGRDQEPQCCIAGGVQERCGDGAGSCRFWPAEHNYMVPDFR